jgi:hypothetical protein
MSAASLASFWGLCLVQGAVVLAPGVVRARPLLWLRARWPVVVLPTAAVIAATFLPPVSEALANELSTLALFTVPPLAMLGAGWACTRADPRLVPLVPVVLGIAWAFPASPAGATAALVLVAVAAAALAAVVAAVLPAPVAMAGIVAWAALDLTTALAQGLERASRAITSAAPALVPELQLQRVELGTASMEFADLFVAAALGAVLAAQGRSRLRAALLVAGLAMALAPFFLVVDVVPGTVPVALALGVEEVRRRRRPVSQAA